MATELWEARCEFTAAIKQLLMWASDNLPQFNIALGEGLVSQTDAADGDYDGPHMKGGGHYTGVAIDLVVYDSAGRYISDGEHQVYQELGKKSRTLDSLARWGGDFSNPDPNHFGFLWGGKS